MSNDSQYKIAAEAAISKNILVEDIKKNAPEGAFGKNTEVLSYYGSDISLEAQHDEIIKAMEEGATLYGGNGQPIDFVPYDPETIEDMENWTTPEGESLSEEDIEKMVSDQTREGAFKFLALAAFNGGGGANPSDTGTILRDKDSNSISFIGYTDKTSLNDQQSNTTPKQYMKGLQHDVDTLKRQGWEFSDEDEDEMREVLKTMDKEFVEAEKQLARATVGPANQVLGDIDKNSDAIMNTWENISNESAKAGKRRDTLLNRFTNKLDNGSPPGSDFKGEEFAVVDPEGFKAPTPRDYLDEAWGEDNYDDPPTEEQIMKAFVASQSDNREITLADGQRVGVTEYYNTNDAGKNMGRIAVGVAKDENYKTDKEGKEKLTEFYGIVEDARKEGLAAIRSANEKLQDKTITDEDGDTMTMGDAVQGLDIIRKLHLGMIDGDEAPGLYAYGSIALVAGEDTVSKENMRKCLGVDSTKDL